MLRSKHLKILLIATLGGSALLLACGPLFPPTMLSRGRDALLAAPWQAFQTTLDRLTPSPITTKARPPADDESHRDQQLRAELADLAQAGASADLLARYRHFRTRFAESPVPADLVVPADLPAEYRLYLTGAIALQTGDTAAAADHFAAVLALPPEQRRAKSTAAAYMLGVIEHRAPDRYRYEPSARFAQVRELAAAGFSDPQGLAAASYGQEARLHYLRRDYRHAIHLYLQQHATGDPTAYDSIRFCTDGILREIAPGEIAHYATDPVVRQLVGARLLTRDFSGYHSEDNLAAARRWLRALGQAGVHNQPEAETLALIAYKTGDYALAADWLAFAPSDGVTNRWIRAKLALRDGDTDTAIKLLAALIRDPALDAYVVDYSDNGAYLPANRVAPGELATLRLARRDFIEALRLFLQSDNWEDTAYVAERLLTTDELAAWLRAAPPPRPPSVHDDRYFEPDDGIGLLHHLLARRLFRDGHLDQARPWFPSGVQLQLDRYTTNLARGRDNRLPDADRATALMTSARLLREHGMELAGTELEPDYFIWSGDFASGISIEQRIALGGPAAPSREEIARANRHLATPALRFHYRYLAADIAWEATTLMPDNSPELASALTEAGGWIKNRAPQSADRFYKALVLRCPETEPGRLAKTQRWFPATTSD